MEEKVIEYRKQNLGYREIAKQLGLTRDKVRYICKKNNLTGKKLEIDYKILLIDFIEKNFPELLLVSDYKNSFTEVILKCTKCDEEFKVRPDSITDIRNGKLRFKGCYKCRRKKYTCEYCEKEIGLLEEIKFKYGSKIKRYYCSEKCLIEKESKECVICNIKFMPTKVEKICSDKCKEKLKQLHIDKKNEQRRADFKPQIKKCKYCGEEFETTFKRQRAEYCSEECSKKNANKVNEIKRRHRIRENGNIDWDITLPKLYDKYNAICAICGEKCNYDDYKETKEGYFIAGETYPSIDHIIPVAKGGTHSWNNVQLAHRYCNTIKNDGYIEEEGQLRII